MKIAILDDYHDTVRTLACFGKLAAHDVKVWNDHLQDTDVLAARDRPVQLIWQRKHNQVIGEPSQPPSG